MDAKEEELFVVTDCCKNQFKVARGRPAAVNALGEVPSAKRDREAIREFLEGLRDSVSGINVDRTHWRDIVPAKEA